MKAIINNDRIKSFFRDVSETNYVLGPQCVDALFAYYEVDGKSLSKSSICLGSIYKFMLEYEYPKQVAGLNGYVVSETDVPLKNIPVKGVSGVWDYDTLVSYAILQTKLVFCPENRANFPILSLPDIVVKRMVYLNYQAYISNELLMKLRAGVNLSIEDVAHYTTIPHEYYCTIHKNIIATSLFLYEFYLKDDSQYDRFLEIMEEMFRVDLGLDLEDLFEAAKNPPYKFPFLISNEVVLIKREDYVYRHPSLTESQRDIANNVLALLSYGFCFETTWIKPDEL